MYTHKQKFISLSSHDFYIFVQQLCIVQSIYDKKTIAQFLISILLLIRTESWLKLEELQQIKQNFYSLLHFIGLELFSAEALFILSLYPFYISLAYQLEDRISFASCQFRGLILLQLRLDVLQKSVLINLSWHKGYVLTVWHRFVHLSCFIWKVKHICNYILCHCVFTTLFLSTPDPQKSPDCFYPSAFILVSSLSPNPNLFVSLFLSSFMSWSWLEFLPLEWPVYDLQWRLFFVVFVF